MRSARCGLLLLGLLGSSVVAAMADEPVCRTVRMSDPGWAGITATSGTADITLTALGYHPDIKALSGPIGNEAMKSGGAEVHTITRVGWPDACPNAALGL